MDRNRIVKGLGASFIIVISVALVVAYRLGIPNGLVAPGVVVLGQPVALMTGEDAEQAVKDRIARILGTPIELISEEKTFPSKVRDLGYKIDEAVVLKRALGFGGRGSIIRRLVDRLTSEKDGYEVPLRGATSLVPSIYLDDISRQVGLPVQNAYWEINWQGQDIVREGHSGRLVDYPRLERRITKAIQRSDDLTAGIRVEIPLKEVRPRIHLDDLEGMEVMSDFTTKFDPTITNRVHNMQIAVERLVGQGIEPRKTWSLNEAVGPRNEQQGFKEATVILEGKFVKGLGGGVSQVTTTVFNAALLADLDVVEHFSHTIPITYVPFGLDATAVYGEKDLKISNNGNELVSIAAAITDDKLRVKMYGFPENQYTIELQAKILEKYEPKIETVEDDTIKTGYQVIEQQAVPGYRVEVDRIFRDASGEVVKSEAAAKAWYRTIDGRVRMGTNPNGTIPESPVAAVDAHPIATPSPAQLGDVAPKQNDTEGAETQPEATTSAAVKGFLPGVLDSLLRELSGE